MKRSLILLFPFMVMASDLQHIVEKVQQNEMLDSLEFAVQAQTKGRDSIVANYLPKVKGSYMYSYIDKDQRGLFDPEHSASLEASAVLFDGFRRSESIMAQNSKIDATKATKQFQKEQLTLNAIKLYYSMRSLQANMEAKVQQEKQLNNELVRLERFFKANSISEDKVEQVRAAVAMTDYELQFLEQNFQELAFSMQTLTNEPFTRAGDATLAESNTTTTNESYELVALKHEIEALDHDAKTKTAEYWPSLIVKDTFSKSIFYPSSFSMPGVTLSLPEVTNKVQVMASMTLWDFFAKSCERQTTVLQQKAKESELAYKDRDSALKKRFASLKLKTVTSKITSSMRSLEASKKSFDYIEKQYHANLVDSTVYLDALTQYFNAKAMLSGAQNEYQIALAEYYFNNSIPLMEMIK